MTELPIPDESVHAYLVAADRIKEGRSPSKTIDAIARPVLIAELRRLLEPYEALRSTPGATVEAMRNRIDELEAGR